MDTCPNFKSSYSYLVYTGDNDEEACALGYLFREIHSLNIKNGLNLEKYIIEELKKFGITTLTKNKKDTFYDKVKEIANGMEPGNNQLIAVSQLKIPKEEFVEHNNRFSNDIDRPKLIMKNKKSIHLDFAVFLPNKNVKLFEVKFGCVFDTKKSKGEVDSLMKIKQLLEEDGYTVADVGLVSFMANDVKQISVKTVLYDVKLFTGLQFLQVFGLGQESRRRIFSRYEENASKNKKMIYTRFTEIMTKYNS